MNLEQLIIDELKAAGATLVAFADITDMAEDIRQGMPRAVSIAIAVTPSIMAQVVNGPTQEYDAEYVRLNALVDLLGKKCAEIIQSAGYNAIASTSEGIGLVRETLSTPLPHKTVATRAGLGWIGKCALLVTEDYGSAVRLNTVLTDAPLPTGVPIAESRCGDCEECVKVCPGNAPSGKKWEFGVDRQEFFDAFTCYKTIFDRMPKFGVKNIVCGMCSAVCPWTNNYVFASARQSVSAKT